jgi:hypothetical protein
MSTNSYISIELRSGEVNTIYCHSDGYLEGVGMTLFEHFQDAKKVKKMIKLGSLSSLGSDIEPPTGAIHNFNQRLPNVCCFYARDRQEKLSISQSKDIQEYLDEYNEEDYNYIYRVKNKTWFMIDKNKKLTTLEDKLLTNEHTFNRTMIFIEKQRLDANITQEVKAKAKIKL